jgi:hypothetical protein
MPSSKNCFRMKTEKVGDVEGNPPKTVKKGLPGLKPSSIESMYVLCGWEPWKVFAALMLYLQGNATL